MLVTTMWENYRKINPKADKYEAWSFGSAPDKLLRLVMEGTKTATASSYDTYEAEQEEVPKVGDCSIVLDSKGEAACVIQTVKLDIVKFKDVTKEQAYLEGEGDRSLNYWREVHEEFFTEELKQCGIPFTEDSRVVCEVFEVLYKDPEYR